MEGRHHGATPQAREAGDYVYKDRWLPHMVASLDSPLLSLHTRVVMRFTHTQATRGDSTMSHMLLDHLTHTWSGDKAPHMGIQPNRAQQTGNNGVSQLRVPELMKYDHVSAILMLIHSQWYALPATRNNLIMEYYCYT